MKNILLNIEHSLELDLVKTVLTRLGFHISLLHRNANSVGQLKEHFPDLVITSVLGNNDTLLQNFIGIRTSRGIPKFIWINSSSKVKTLNEVQKKIIDDILMTPIQPEVLIQSVCTLLGLEGDEYVKKYRAFHNSSKTQAHDGPIIVKGGHQQSQQSPLIWDKKRSENYKAIADKVEKQDKVFTVKDLMSHTSPDGGGGNTQDLLTQKKSFLKSLFKK